MKNFDWTTFTRKIAIKAPLSEIYNAWTKPSEIERWFLNGANFFDSTGHAIDPEAQFAPGNTYEWSWYLYDVVEKGNITYANGKDHVQFTFAGDCLVNIQLLQQDESVVVELKQTNIPTDDESKQGIRLGCDSGWSFFLLNLKSVYEGGLDLRNKDASFHGMLNN